MTDGPQSSQTYIPLNSRSEAHFSPGLAVQQPSPFSQIPLELNLAHTKHVKAEKTKASVGDHLRPSLKHPW